MKIFEVNGFVLCVGVVEHRLMNRNTSNESIIRYNFYPPFREENHWNVSEIGNIAYSIHAPGIQCQYLANMFLLVHRNCYRCNL